MLPDHAAVQVMYFRHFGKLANLKHPRTYNEKINWRKLYQRDPRFCIYSDKYLVKEEVAKIIGWKYIIPTLWVGTDPEAIPFEDIEPPYVIKVNHSTGDNIFVRRRDDINKSEFVASLKRQMAYNHGRAFREWGYLYIQRRILIERLVGAPEITPNDYKLYTYGGRVHFILVVRDRFGSHRQNYYDRGWNLLPISCVHPGIGHDLPRPPDLDLMIELAERIARPFDHVRVDLYQTPQGIFFGETTFYDGAGYEKISPPEWDLKFGEPWIIPNRHLTSPQLNLSPTPKL